MIEKFRFGKIYYVLNYFVEVMDYRIFYGGEGIFFKGNGCFDCYRLRMSGGLRFRGERVLFFFWGFELVVCGFWGVGRFGVV